MGSKDKAVKAGAVALKSGIVHIDSAQVYGTEAEIILAIKEAGMKREDVYVTTKCEWRVSQCSEIQALILDSEDIRRYFFTHVSISSADTDRQRHPSTWKASGHPSRGPSTNSPSFPTSS